MRTQYQDGTVELFVKFTDGVGDLITPSVGPTIDIFPPDKDPEDPDTVDGDALVLNATISSLGDIGQAGTYLIETVSTGMYRYRYPTSPTTEVGTYFDRWTATIDGGVVQTTFNFEVLEKLNTISLSLGNNMRVTITLDESIASTSSIKLSQDYEFHFYTPLSPFYASNQLIDLEIGSFISALSIEAIDYAILEASIEADVLSFKSIKNTEWFEHARRQYVICRAAHILMRNSVSNPLRRKKLAELEVEWDNSFKDKFNELDDCVQEMKRILNSGGELGEGTSLRPLTGIKGGSHIDRPAFGRTFDGSGRGQNVRYYPDSDSLRTVHGWSETPRWRDATGPKNSSEDS